MQHSLASVLTCYQPFNTDTMYTLHYTSYVTGRHRGPKQKHRAGYRASSLQRTSYLCDGLLCYASSIFHRRVW